MQPSQTSDAGDHGSAPTSIPSAAASSAAAPASLLMSGVPAFMAALLPQVFPPQLDCAYLGTDAATAGNLCSALCYLLRCRLSMFHCVGISCSVWRILLTCTNICQVSMTAGTGLVKGPCTGGAGEYALVFFVHTMVSFAACNLSLYSVIRCMCVASLYMYQVWLLLACAGTTAILGSPDRPIGQAVGLSGAMMIS